jgi:muramoyltetrapeptide carboxypeptidase
MTRTWPPPLQPGDLVVAVAPSGPADPDRVSHGIAVAESWGLRVRVAPHVFGGHDRLGYLAAPDQARAADIQQAWCDPDVQAVWAVRGGYGAQRMVDLLDWPAMRVAGCKQLIGFSDVTALHSRLGRELGQVTIHGSGLATVDQLTDLPSAQVLQALLFGELPPGSVLATGRPASSPSKASGHIRGQLAGGNLSLLAADVGIEPVPGGPTILLLEEVNEPAYRIDRMLTQLLRSGWFENVVGVVLGNLGLPDDELVLDRLGPLGMPILTLVEVGHGSRNLALPLGADVRLEAGTLTLADLSGSQTAIAHSRPDNSR